MKTLMKPFIVACLLATVFASSTALAFEWPSDPQPIRGVEGPDNTR